MERENMFLHTNEDEQNIIIEKNGDRVKTNVSNGRLVIAHLADVHVKNARRSEYARVFQGLYEQLRNVNPNLIVVVGDVFDTKTFASAVNFRDVSLFLTALTKIATVILIKGNHDTSVKVVDAMDLLSAVIEHNPELQPPHLYFFNKSGFYYQEGIVWGVNSPEHPSLLTFEDLKTWLESNKKKYEDRSPFCDLSQAIRICLFHEELNTSKFCNDQEIRRYRLELKHFEGYDAAMGGHIHLRQGGQRWAYPGSVIQQNIGESHAGHGFLVWEFDRFQPRAPPVRREINVYNETGFVLLKFIQGKDVTPHKEWIPKYPYYYEVSHDAESKLLIDQLLEPYGFGFPPRDFRLLKSKTKTKQKQPPLLSNSTSTNDNKDNKQDALQNETEKEEQEEHEQEEENEDDGVKKEVMHQFGSLDCHLDMIRKCLGGHQHTDAVLQLHRQYWNQFGQVVLRNKGRIRLLRFEFDNLFCFGEGNAVDFGRLEKKVSGIIAPNHSGKSSFVHALLFALYDVLPGKMAKKEAMRKKATHWRLHLTFELNGKQGSISKSGTAQHSECSFTYNGENLTRGTIVETNHEIQQLLGSYQDAALASFALQNEPQHLDFVLMKPVERRQTLTHLFNLGSFRSVAKELSKVRQQCKARTEVLKAQSKKLNLAEAMSKQQQMESKISELETLQLPKILQSLDALNTEQGITKEQVGKSVLLKEQLDSCAKHLHSLETLLSRRLGQLFSSIESISKHESTTSLSPTCTSSSSSSSSLSSSSSTFLSCSLLSSSPLLLQWISNNQRLTWEQAIDLQREVAKLVSEELSTMQNWLTQRASSSSLSSLSSSATTTNESIAKVGHSVDFLTNMTDDERQGKQLSEEDGLECDGTFDDLPLSSDLQKALNLDMERCQMQNDLNTFRHQFAAEGKTLAERFYFQEQQHQKTLQTLNESLHLIQQQLENLRVQYDAERHAMAQRHEELERKWQADEDLEDEQDAKDQLDWNLFLEKLAEQQKIILACNQSIESCNQQLAQPHKAEEDVLSKHVEQLRCCLVHNERSTDCTCCSKVHAWIVESAQMHSEQKKESLNTLEHERKTRQQVENAKTRAETERSDAQQIYRKLENERRERFVDEEIFNRLKSSSDASRQTPAFASSTTVVSHRRQLQTSQRRAKRAALKQESAKLTANMEGQLKTLEQQRKEQQAQKRQCEETFTEHYKLVYEKKQSERQAALESEEARISSVLTQLQHVAADWDASVRRRLRALYLIRDAADQWQSTLGEYHAFQKEHRHYVPFLARSKQLAATLLQWEAKRNDLESQLNRLKPESYVNIKAIEDHKQAVEEYQRQQKEMDELDTYALMLKEEGGIGDQLVQQSYHELQMQVNHILSQMNVHFVVEIDAQCNIRVCNTINRQHQPPINIALASGFQKFALKLAFRLVLWRHAKIPIPDCLVTDEGFGSCDDENLNGIAEHLETLVTQPSSPSLMFSVTHLPEMQNRMEHSLTISIHSSGNVIQNTVLEALVHPFNGSGSRAKKMSNSSSSSSSSSLVAEKATTPNFNNNNDNNTNNSAFTSVNDFLDTKRTFDNNHQNKNAASVKKRKTNIPTSSLTVSSSRVKSGPLLQKKQKQENLQRQGGSNNKTRTVKTANNFIPQNDGPILVVHPDKIGWFYCRLCNKSVKLADRHLSSESHHTKLQNLTS